MIHSRRLFAVLFAATLSFLSCHSAIHAQAPAVKEAETLQGKCTSVFDGDNLTVMVAGTVETKVRLEGIDAPEPKQAFSEQAKAALSSLVSGKEVTLIVKGKDRVGTTLAVVKVGDENVNLELVRLGLAWRFEKYSKDPVLLAAQNKAKEAKRGLWSDPAPLAPWDFRAQQRLKK